MRLRIKLGWLMVIIGFAIFMCSVAMGFNPIVIAMGVLLVVWGSRRLEKARRERDKTETKAL